MANNTHIVLIPVDNTESRKICESIENETFSDIKVLRKAIPTDSEIWPISDFMDACNNQQFTLEFNNRVIENSFITYVTINQ